MKVKGKLFFISLLFIYSISYAGNFNMNNPHFKQTIVKMSPIEIEQEISINNKSVDVYIGKDLRLEELNEKINFSDIFNRQSINANKSFHLHINGAERNFSLEDENNKPYKIWGMNEIIYQNEDKETIKQRYQITISNEDASVTVKDNMEYVTKGVVFTVQVFQGKNGKIMAQNKMLRSLLDTSMSFIPYIKSNPDFGDVSLMNTYYSIDNNWNVLWISDNVLVQASSIGISQEQVINICGWIEKNIY